MDSWMLFKEEGEKFFKLKDFQKACDCYKGALTEIESKPELKVEAAKITSNLSLMYYKLSKEQKNDESLLHESKLYAKKTIRYNPNWIRGYLRLVDVCKLSKDVDDILNAITMYLRDNKDAVLNDDFLSLLKEVKYYTHKTIMMLSPSWRLVKYKSNVVFVDPLEAGHFKDFIELCHKKSLKNISVLVRPGVYVGSYIITNATIDIVGDCNVEINPITKAIDKDPTVIFTNILLSTGMDLPPMRSGSTFHFIDSEVSLKRISVYGEKKDDILFIAILCGNTYIKLLECCFISKCSSSLYCSESSNLYCNRCRCVEAVSGVLIRSKSHAKLTDCFISEMDRQGIVAKDDAEMISLKHCTITKCKKHGLLVYNGAKMAKIIDSYFEDNCSNGYDDSIQLKGCRVLVKNTSVKSSKFLDNSGIANSGIAIDGGSGDFDNVVIENCAVGMTVQANVEIKNCIINNCSMFGIDMYNFVKGAVVLENNSITKCPVEIARSDDASMPTCKGERKHAIFTYPSINAENEIMFREMRISRKKGSIATNISSEYLELISCDYCGMQERDAQRYCKTLKACAKCKMVFYCSPECQRKTWKLHKLRCEFYVKTKLAAREKTKNIQRNQECTNENKKSNFKTKENDGSVNNS